jgi:Glucose-6-phosphate dehydrogenase, NAD binding domain
VRSADVLVVFGISGDLAKVMTFRSLYRLEARGLLACPIVGVAANDWSADELRSHARAAIEAGGEPLDEAVFERFAARLSYVSGDFADARTFQQVASAIHGARDACLLPRDPAVAVRHGHRGSCAGRPHGGGASRRREALRPRPRLGARAQRRDPPVPRRIPAVPDRSLPGQAGARRDPLPPVRERDLRAALEPRPRRLGADHHGRAVRRGGPRPLLRSGGRAARRRRQPPHAGPRGRREWNARRPATRRR